MSPLLNDLSLVEHIDYISMLDGRKSVRNRDGGATLRGEVEGVLDDAFGRGVECRGSFVKEAATSLAYMPSCRKGKEGE